MASALRFDPWSPSRPFPVQRWQATRFSFRVPHPPPPLHPRSPDQEQRREFELLVLVSHLPPWLRARLVPTLRWEAKRRFPWSQERCANGSALMAQRRFPAPSLEQGRAAWLRFRLGQGPENHRHRAVALRPTRLRYQRHRLLPTRPRLGDHAGNVRRLTTIQWHRCPPIYFT